MYTITRQDEIDRMVAKFETDVKFDDAGIPYWKTNDRVPPKECVEVFHNSGLLTTPVELIDAARDEQNQQFFAEYRVAQANRSPEQLAEEKMEMRAAFGPGKTVVNIITGERTTL
jgi:hypothetical protein